MKKGIISLALAGFSVSGFAQLNMTQLGRLTYPFELANIWGYADSAGREYALVGTYAGMSIVDLDTPSAPKELFAVPGPRSTWRELKTWNNHAYVVHDATDMGDAPVGLTIVDLNYLPDSVAYSTWTGGILNIETIHTIWIDENGVGYLFGSNYGNGGAVMISLANPKVPVFLGNYNTNYVHDGFVRGDTMFSSEIYAGWLAAVDVSVKTSPVVLGTRYTPSTFTHNCWPSDDNKYIFTTDEVTGAWIASYDITDLSNMKELDRAQSSPGTGVIPHNTHYLNGWIITSYYRDGVTIHDVSRPDNMIMTGYFDTSPLLTGNGFNGCWGVYPYLPSGIVIASDMERGLYVLGADYLRGCYLEGTVRDSATTNPLNGVQVVINTAGVTDYSSLTGVYKTGTADSGTYSVTFSKVGYITKTVTGVALDNGVLTSLDVDLVSLPVFSVTGTIARTDDSTGIPFAKIYLDNDTSYNFSGTADANGNFVISGVYPSTYKIYGGKWGFVNGMMSGAAVGAGSNNFTLYLDEGWYDDFLFDFGWSKSTSGGTISGFWEMGDPVGTYFSSILSNPENDVPGDLGKAAYVTGNGGGSASDDDIDNGRVILESPVFDLSAYNDPRMAFSTWFFNDGGAGSPNDSFVVLLSNGASEVTLHLLTLSQVNGFGSTIWKQETFRISDHITPTASMRLTVKSGDWNPGHLVEAAIDYFYVVDSPDIGLPYIVSTNPVDSATGINTNEDIVIVFSEEIDTTTFSFAFVPDPGGWTVSWDAAKTTATLSHNNFNSGVWNAIFVSSAADISGNGLIGGVVPNPWAFYTGTTGIHEWNSGTGIKVFPNPLTSDGVIVFTGLKETSGCRLELYNSIGIQSVMQAAPGEKIQHGCYWRIDGSRLVPGTYWFRVTQNGLKLSYGTFMIAR